MSTRGAARSWHPVRSSLQASLIKFMIRWWLTGCEWRCERLCSDVGISSEQVYNILHQYVSMRKLSLDQKRDRVKITRTVCSCSSIIRRTLSVVQPLWMIHRYITTLLRPKSNLNTGMPWWICTCETPWFDREGYGNCLFGFARHYQHPLSGKS